MTAIAEIPAKYSRLTADEARALITLTEEALQYPGVDTEAMTTHLQFLQIIAGLSTGYAATTVDDGVDRPRPVGQDSNGHRGGRTGNHATDKQVNYLTRLLAERDTTGVKVPATLDGISKTAASALIDRLSGRPYAARTETTSAPARPVNMASPKQLDYLKRLFTERVTVDAIPGYSQPEIDLDLDTLTSKQASAMIELMQNAPRRQVALDADTDLAPGAYMVEGRVIRVYKGQRGGMLAQELVDATALDRASAWNYLGLASRFVPADAHRMTVAECEAASAGTEDHGWCCVCGRELNDVVSVARGIGPVCRAKQGE